MLLLTRTFRPRRGIGPASSRLCYDSILGPTLQLRHNIVSRRAFLAAASVFAACSHKLAPRYRAWLFMASAAEKAVIVDDLSAFRRSGSIPVGGVPDLVLSARGKLFAVCAENQTVLQIDPVRRIVIGKTDVGGKIAGAVLTTDGSYLAVAVIHPAAVVFLATATNRAVRRTLLPDAPHAIATAGAQAAVLIREKSTALARVSVPDGVLLGVSDMDAGLVSALGYRKDGETIYTAAPDSLQIVSLDAASGSVLARLPVPIHPARFCVDGTGGQVFVTGADRAPQLVIFSPYQDQIDQTLYAGHALFGMAVAPVRNLLFLSNPDAGDVTIMDIGIRRIVSSIRTGGKPGEILIAPSSGPEEYAFVIDSESGDVSVIHIPVVLHKPGDAFIAEPPKPVFAVFHGGVDPRSAVIVPYTA